MAKEDDNFFENAAVFEAEGAVAPMSNPAEVIPEPAAPAAEPEAVAPEIPEQPTDPAPAAELEPTDAVIGEEVPEEPAQEEPLAEAEAEQPESPETPESIQLDDDFYRVEATKLYQAGVLTDDFDINAEQITSEDIQTSYETKMAQPLTNRIYQHLTTEMRQNGWDNPDIMKRASMLENGIAEDTMRTIDYYKGKAEQDKFETEDEEIDFLEAFAKDSEMTKTAATAFLDSVKEDEEMRLKSIKESREWYKDFSSEIEEDADTQYQANLEARKQRDAAEAAFVTQAVNSGKLGEYQMPTELHSLFKQGVTVRNTPMQTAQGTTAVTAFDAFAQAFSSSKQYQLAVFAQILNASIAPAVVTKDAAVKFGRKKTSTQPASGVVTSSKANKGEKIKKEDAQDLMVFNASN